MRVFIKYFLLLAILLCLVLVLSLSIHGLPDDLTRRLEQRLQLPGMSVTVNKIKLGIFEGVIATDVRCHLKGDIGAPLLTAERIVLQPRLWHRQPGAFGLRRVIIKNAAVRLPVPGMADDAAPLILGNAQARVLFESRRILRFESFSACLDGIMLAGHGRITLPEQAPVRTSAGGTTDAVRECLQYYRALCFIRPPRIETEFDLHPAEPERNTLRLRMETQGIAMDPYIIHGLDCDIRLANNLVNGTFQIRQAEIWEIATDQISGTFEIDADTVRLQNVEAFAGVGDQRGPINIQAVYDRRKDECTGQAHAWFHPTVVVPMLDRLDQPVAAKIVRDFKFTRKPPRATAVFSGAVLARPYLNIHGNIQAENPAYSGVSVQIAQTAFDVGISATNAFLAFGPCVATRQEGALQGHLKLDFMDGTLQFDALSAIDPHAAARIIHPFIAAILAPFTFDGPTRARAAGLVEFEGSTRDEIELAMEVQRAGWDFLRADYCAFNLHLLEKTVEITDIAGGIFQGKFNGQVIFNPPALARDSYIYAADINATDLDFNTLIQAWTGKPATDPYQGRFDLRASLAGPVDADALAHATGNGHLHIVSGRIFQIPLFGGLSDLLGKIVPGLSMVMRQTDARAQFTIRDGKLSSDEILIEGDVLSLRANGDYHFSGQLDFKVQVTLLRKHTLIGSIVRIATMPVSKILEFHLTGTIAAPRWNLAYMPRDLFSFFGAGTGASAD